jgi:hypothetical protein
LIPTETAFVRAALGNIGSDGSPYWSHAYPPPKIGSVIDVRIYEWFLGYVVVLVGGREGSLVAGINKKMHETIRKRALKKAAKKQ